MTRKKTFTETGSLQQVLTVCVIMCEAASMWYVPELTIRNLNVLVWLPSSILFSFLLMQNTESINTNLGKCAVVLALPVVYHSLINDQSLGYAAIFYGFYGHYVYDLLPKAAMHLVGGNVLIIACFACALGHVATKGRYTEPLTQIEVGVFAVLDLLLKVWWYAALSRKDPQPKKHRSQFVATMKHTQRKWHGRVVDIDTLQDQLAGWKKMWNQLVSKLEKDHKVAITHLDPNLVQHVELSLQGIYAVRVAPTSEREYFQNVLPKSEIESLGLPQTAESYAVKATIFLGKNEGDCIDAQAIERIDGALIWDHQTFYYKPSDNKINFFWHNKCRPPVVHLLAVHEDAKREEFQRPELKEFPGKLFKIEIYENLALRGRRVNNPPRAIDDQFYVVCKELNSKIKSRSVAKKAIELTEKQMSSQTGKSGHLKKLIDLDWVAEKLFDPLMNKVFEGKKISNRLYIDAAAVDPESRVVAEDGKLYRVGELYPKDKWVVVPGLKMNDQFHRKA